MHFLHRQDPRQDVHIQLVGSTLRSVRAILSRLGRERRVIEEERSLRWEKLEG